MGLRLRILKVVHPDGGGPRPMRVLLGLARTAREKNHAGDIVRERIQCGALVRYGDKKGAKYGLPKGTA